MFSKNWEGLCKRADRRNEGGGVRCSWPNHTGGENVGINQQNKHFNTILHRIHVEIQTHTSKQVLTEKFRHLLNGLLFLNYSSDQDILAGGNVPLFTA